jgi:hypothetical protein
MKEHDSLQIEVDSKYQQKIFIEFISYLQTGKLGCDSNDLVEMLDIACFYEVSDLKLIIEGILANNLDPGNLRDILEMAKGYDCHTLRLKCYDFANRNMVDMRKAGALVGMPKEDLSYLRLR